MFYPKCKIYRDGSHYVAIVPNPTGERHVRPITEDLIDVIGANGEQRTLTKRQYFDELYDERTDLKRWELKNELVELMQPYFENGDATRLYVNAGIKRRARNVRLRMLRLRRKVDLNGFDYFCTFTYDDKKHTEQTFQRRLRDTFKKLCYRRDWKYVGVWERGANTDRLHFHGLFSIPEGQMVGELVPMSDYSARKGAIVDTVQNTYFNERFGRCDFKEIDPQYGCDESIAYLTKYLQKTGERLVYSKGLPQFFVSDVDEDDVICERDDDPNKLILFDDFACWDDGCKIGKVTDEVIKQLPKVD